jgi:hypothetical protein
MLRRTWVSPRGPGLGPTSVDHILGIVMIVIIRIFPVPNLRAVDGAFTGVELGSAPHHDVPDDGANMLSRYAQRAASAPVGDGLVVRGGNDARVLCGTARSA